VTATAFYIVLTF